MANLMRALNSAGIAQFRGYLARLRDGVVEEPPYQLLVDVGFSVELPADVEVAAQRFSSRFVLGSYFCTVLERFRPEDLERNAGLWSWLSLFFFDQVCPRANDGSRRPGQDYRHIPDFGYRYRYRHLLYGPYQVYRRHRGHAVSLLSGPAHIESTIYHEITSRQDLIANRGVIEATFELYMDRKRRGPKEGSQQARAAPGSIRRFVRVLQQLEVNYDVYGMAGKEILGLLPSEFDVWLKRGQTTLKI
jgi:hypothetical protein